MQAFSLIVATDSNNGIGINGDLPWRLKADMAFFKKTTIGMGNNAVIMGRNTWQSIPEKFRPLPDRLNIVLSRKEQLNLSSHVKHFTSLEEALSDPDLSKKDECFVIGGGQIYHEAITHELCHRVIMTKIQKSFSCDTFFPALPNSFFLKEESSLQSENELSFTFQTYLKNK